MPKVLPNATDLYAITDSRLSRGRSLTTVVQSLLAAGIRIIQYREKHMKMGAMLEECRILRALTEEAGACFIVDDFVDIALLSKADGVHIGQEDLSVQDVRALAGSKLLIGVSTHAKEQAEKAVRDGADYIGVGPIFATKTKEDVVAPVGLSYLSWVKEHITIPFVAIGGIKAHNIGQVVAAGASCCALVSEFVGADDIEASVARVRAAMHA